VYRETIRPCPACEAELPAGDGILSCAGCAGSWVPRAVLRDALTALRLPLGQIDALEGARCGEHDGAWFTAAQLVPRRTPAPAPVPAPGLRALITADRRSERCFKAIWIAIAGAQLAGGVASASAALIGAACITLGVAAFNRRDRRVWRTPARIVDAADALIIETGRPAATIRFLDVRMDDGRRISVATDVPPGSIAPDAQAYREALAAHEADDLERRLVLALRRRGAR
jgi:hypothetical protein